MFLKGGEELSIVQSQPGPTLATPRTFDCLGTVLVRARTCASVECIPYPSDLA